MEVELSAAAAAAMIGVAVDDDLDVEDDLSIGAEVTCSGDSGGEVTVTCSGEVNSSSSPSEVSILEELLKAENGNGDALACLQVRRSFE